ncbi:DUF4190 domain-containing protein [Corynebacterium sp. S7]
MTDKSNPNDPYRGDHPENFPDSGDSGSSAQGSQGSQGSEGYGSSPYGSGGAQGSSNSYGDNTYGAGYPGGNQSGYPGGYPGGFEAGYQAGVAEKNNIALWAMILGIISLLLVVTIALFPLGAILGIVAIVLGILGIRKANSIIGPEKRRGMAITGLVTGILAVLASIAIVLMAVAGFSMLEGSGALDCVVHLEGDNPDEVAYEQCIRDSMTNPNN